MKSKLPIFALFFLLSAPAFADGSFRNPILRGFHPDPSICVVGDDFYLVNSTFQYYPGVPIYHSKDLVSWEQIGSCLDSSNDLDLSGAVSWGGIYAPTIRYNDGTFYMIVTNCSHGGNLIVRAKNPSGPWSKPSYVNIGGIDPSLYFENGKCYYTGTTDGNIVLCPINPETGELLGEVKTIWNGTGGRYPEGPHIYKKDGWYYLLIAEGGTEFGHKITIARSKNLYGPYEGNPANPILTHFSQKGQGSSIQGLGHGDFLQAPDGSWWMVCLGFRPQGGQHHLMGRETFLAPVSWEKNQWPVINGGEILSEQMTCRTLPLQGKPYDTERNLDFTSGDKLDIEWLYLRNPHFENYNYTLEGLEIKASKWNTNETEESPSFVAYRQGDIKFNASVKLSLIGSKSSEAGISVYMDAPSHYDLFIRKVSKKRYEAGIRYRLGEITHEESFPVDGPEITLSVNGSDYSYAFFYTSKDGKMRRAGSANTCYISSETASGFTGVVLGLYATDPTGADSKALIKNFSYKAEQ